MNGEPLHILMEYDHWANQIVFGLCRSRAEAELDRRFDIGLGSLRRTLIHVVANMEHWFDRASCQDPPRFHSPGTQPLDDIIERYNRVFEQIRVMVTESDSAFLQGEVVSVFREPTEIFVVRFPRLGALLQLLDHGTHHRAQCLNMLRLLGVESLPELSLIDSCQELVERHTISNTPKSQK